MKIFAKSILPVLVFLAISSGMTKILLMPQEAEFFGPFGFTDTILILFGGVQVLGGALLILMKTRVIGASLIMITFIISAIVLLMASKISLAIITFVFVLLLLFVIRRTLNEQKTHHSMLDDT